MLPIASNGDSYGFYVPYLDYFKILPGAKRRPPPIRHLIVIGGIGGQPRDHGLKILRTISG